MATHKVHIFRDYRSFIDPCKLSYKANSHISKVEIDTKQNYAILTTQLRKQRYFLKKTFRHGDRARVFIWEHFLLGYRNRDLGNWASPVNRDHMKRPRRDIGNREENFPIHAF